MKERRGNRRKKWVPVRKLWEVMSVSVSYFPVTVILFSALLMRLMAFNREHYLHQKLCRWKIKALDQCATRRRLATPVNMTVVNISRFDGWGRRCFYFGGFLSAHKVLELWLCARALGLNFWLMSFACVDKHTGRNHFLFPGTIPARRLIGWVCIQPANQRWL